MKDKSVIVRKASSCPLGDNQDINTLISADNICGVIFLEIHSLLTHIMLKLKLLVVSVMFIKYPLLPIHGVLKVFSIIC